MKNQEIKFRDNLDSYSVFIGSNTLNILPHQIKKLCPIHKKNTLPHAMPHTLPHTWTPPPTHTHCPRTMTYPLGESKNFKMIPNF